MNTNEKDISFAEDMCRSYSAANGAVSTADKLRGLDREVKRPGRVISIIMGTIGVLVMGGGMSLTMVNGNMAVGIVLGITGMIVAGAAYPIYSALTKSRKRKYADQVIALSGEITKNKR